MDFVKGPVIGWIAGQTYLIIICIILNFLKTCCRMR